MVHHEAESSPNSGDLPEKLLRRLRERDEPAWRQVYDRYEAAVFGLCRYLVSGRQDDAADVFQEVWLRAAQEIEDYPRKTSFFTWLSKIADRAASRLKYDRRPDRSGQLTHDPALLLADEAEQDAVVGVMCSVDGLLAQIGDRDRKIIEARYFENLDVTEIAERFNLKVDTAKHRLSRALDRLRAVARV